MVLEEAAARVGGQFVPDPATIPPPGAMERLAMPTLRAWREAKGRQLLGELQSLCPGSNAMVWKAGLEQEHEFQKTQEEGAVVFPAKGRGVGFCCAVFWGEGVFRNRGHEGDRNWLGNGMQVGNTMSFAARAGPGAPEHVRDDLLVPGRKLLPGESLVSRSRAFALTLRRDGDLALETQGGEVLWLSHTAQRCTGTGTGTGAGAGTGMGAPPGHLEVEEHGNVVAYDSEGQPFWDTLTWDLGIGPYSLIMQDDGNLVLRDGTGRSLWDTGTGQTAE